MNFTIYRGGPGTSITIPIDENTKLVQKLMGEDYIAFDQEYTDLKDIQIGDYTVLGSDNYYVNSLPDIRKKATTRYSHKIRFEAIYYDLGKVAFLLNGESDFYLMGNLEDFLDLIVTNMNRDGAGWSTGTIDNSNKEDYKNLHFSAESCMAILQRLIQEYDGEFYLTAKAISFTDTIGNATGLSFEYGQGKGLRSIDRVTVTSQNVVTRAYGFGSSKNLDSSYGKRRLEFDNGGNNYLESNTATYGVIELVKYFEEVYPSFTGSITAVDGSDELVFADSTIDFNINSYLLPGITPKIHFNTGDLGGYEFEISEYVHTSNSVTLINYTDEYIQTLPNSLLKPSVGDNYKILDITMPTAYVTAAEDLLESKTQAFLDANDTPTVQYRLEPDERYIKENSVSLSLGDNITIIDLALGIDVTTRIIELLQPLADTNKYRIEVSNNVHENLVQRLYANDRDSRRKQEISNTGNIPEKRWVNHVERGDHSGRTWQTDSGLPGHYKRVVLDAENNNLVWYDDENTAVIVIDDNLIGTFAGILLRDGVIFSFKDGSNSGSIYANAIQIIGNEGIYIAQFLNGRIAIQDTMGVDGWFSTIEASANAKKRIGVQGRSSINNGSNNDDAIGIYGTASIPAGTGKSYSGYFENGDFLIKLGDAAGTNKLTIEDSNGVEIFSVDSDGNVSWSGSSTGPNTTRITSVDSPYTMLSNDEELFCDTDGGAITVNLLAGVNRKRHRVINCGSSGNDVTLTPDGAELLKGVNGNQTLSDIEDLNITYETTKGWF